MIEEIYMALEEKQSVVLIGPQGCGKSTVITGVLASSFFNVPLATFPVSSFNKGSIQPLPYTIILVNNGPLPYDTFKKFMDRRDCSFIMELDLLESMPEGYYTDHRVRVIEWMAD